MMIVSKQALNDIVSALERATHEITDVSPSRLHIVFPFSQELAERAAIMALTMMYPQFDVVIPENITFITASDTGEIQSFPPHKS